MTQCSLAGRRILVTRAARQAGKLSEALRDLGAEPVEVPVLEILPPESFAALDEALLQLPTYDWLILTSTNTVRALVERAAVLSVRFGSFSHVSVAAIGEATADAARREGLQITVIPESYVAESLLAGLAGRVAGKKILLARSAIARDVIPDALRKIGAVVDVADAYRNALPSDAPDRLRQALTNGIDAVTLTSSSSVKNLAAAARAADLAWPFDIPAVSIGPITTATLREMGWEPIAEANPSDIAGLVGAVVRALTRA